MAIEETLPAASDAPPAITYTETVPDVELGTRSNVYDDPEPKRFDTDAPLTTSDDAENPVTDSENVTATGIGENLVSAAAVDDNETVGETVSTVNARPSFDACVTFPAASREATQTYHTPSARADMGIESAVMPDRDSTGDEQLDEADTATEYETASDEAVHDTSGALSDTAPVGAEIENEPGGTTSGVEVAVGVGVGVAVGVAVGVEVGVAVGVGVATNRQL